MMRRLARADGGTGLIEFAFALPVLLFLLIGLIDVGRYTYLGVLAQHAARAGVQYGSQSVMSAVSTAAIQNAALQDAQGLSSWQVAHTIICTVNSEPSQCPVNNTNAVSPNLVYYVQVQVTGTFNPLVSYPGIPSSIPVTGTAQMRIAAQ
jgi:Flp pilus assembly protein TadG